MLYFFFFYHVYYISSITLFFSCIVLFMYVNKANVVQSYTEELSATASLPIPLTQWHSHVVHYFFSDLVPFVAYCMQPQTNGLSERKGWMKKTCYKSKKNEKEWKWCRNEGRTVIMDVVGAAEADRRWKGWGGGAVQWGRGSSTW